MQLSRYYNLNSVFRDLFTKYTISGDNREKVHLFSSRTQKLSFSSPTILGWRRPGKIGHCQKTKNSNRKVAFFILIHAKACIFFTFSIHFEYLGTLFTLSIFRFGGVLFIFWFVDET